MTIDYGMRFLPLYACPSEFNADIVCVCAIHPMFSAAPCTRHCNEIIKENQRNLLWSEIFVDDVNKHIPSSEWGTKGISQECKFS